MMKSLHIFFSIAATVFAYTAPGISAPPNPFQCSTNTLTITGSAGPFTLNVWDATKYVILETITGIAGPHYQWTTIEPVGTALFFDIIDASTNDAVSTTMFVQTPVIGSVVPQKTLPGAGQCLSGDTGSTLTSAATCSSLTADGSTIYVGSSTTACCSSIPSGTFVCKTPAPAPDCTANGGNVPQQTLPAAGQCKSGDTGATLTSASTCASLTSDGSTIYVDSSVDVCCDNIPAGTFYCDTPATPAAPTCDLVPTNAAASASCLASDRSIALSAAYTCDFLNSILGATMTDFYTVSGSNICCDSIPTGTIICVPDTSSSTSTCPTTTSPPTTTATQTNTGTATTTTAPPSGPSGYVGCYEDSVATRVLPNQIGISQVTVELCFSACSSAGFQYAGLEWSQECWCGNTAPATLATDGRCDMTCAGNSQEICGGGNGLSVYTTGSGTIPSVLQLYNSWSYTGCYEDSVAARTMPTTVTTIAANSMTVEKCLDACNALGHSYAGLEWSQECYCADALPPTQATDGTCNMVCKGNNLEVCGGGNGLTVYTYTYNPPYYSRRAF